MIATRNYMPLLQDQHGEVSAIEAGWLVDALERAARKAGFGEWWLADHVTSSVCSYLGGVYQKNVVGLGRLQEAVKKALQDIGYEEIARCFYAESPTSGISLLSCAQKNSTDDIDAFYAVLADRISELHLSKSPVFHFSDLRPCLLYFNGAKGVPERLRSNDVVDFLRDKLGSLEWDREVNCSIS